MNKSKAVIKIVLINLLILFALFFYLEILSFKKLHPDDNWGINKYSLVKKFDYKYFEPSKRPVALGTSLKRPILFFGCSFAYGYPLPNNKTLPYFVSNLSGRTAHNMSGCAWGTQQMYDILNSSYILNTVPDAEYIVYLFIYDHFQRLFDYVLGGSNITQIKYKYTDGKFIKGSNFFSNLYSLYMVKFVQGYLSNKFRNNPEKSFPILKNILIESFRLSKDKYKNSKFIILVYKEKDSFSLYSSYQSYFEELFNQLSELGIIVIDVGNLLGHGLEDDIYVSSDGYHPSELVWQELAPKLVKKLDL